MSKIFVKDTEMIDIANAIRAKNGTEDTYKPSEMPQAILDISAEGGSDGEYIGMKYTEFTTIGGNGKYPKVIDARSLENLLTGANTKLSIMNYAFYNLSPYLNDSLFLYLEEVYLPSGITALVSSFYHCKALTTIHGDLSDVTTIKGAFRYCSSLAKIPYMPNLDVIQAYSFADCTSLTSANIYKKPTTFAATAFSSCTNLYDIYVPWSEGEVANAPWGATNATIHYNTEFDADHNPIISEV